MKSFLKKGFRYNEAMLAIALLLFLTAFLLNKYVVRDSSAAYYASRIQHAIHDKETDYRKLSGDTVLLRKLITLNYSEPELKDLLEDRKGYGFFIYELHADRQPRLLFWNSQTALPPINFMQESGVSRLVTLKNGFYVHASSVLHLGNKTYSVEALIPVLYKYFVEIENLQTEFAGFPDALRRVQFSTTQATYTIRSVYGNPLFYLDPVNTSIQEPSWWIFFVTLAGIFFLFWYIHNTADELGRRKGLIWGIVLLIGVLTLLRLLVYYDPGLLNLRQFELFDPSIYSSSFLLSSLGDLAINVSLFCWIALFINRRFGFVQVTAPASGLWRWLVASCCMILLVLLSFGIARILQSLVADAKISFNVTNFFSLLNPYSFVGFMMLATMALGYFLIAQVLLKLLKAYAGQQHYLVYIIVAALGLMVLTFTKDTAVVELNLFVLIWLLCFIALMNLELFSGLHFQMNVSEVLFWLFVFSFSIAAIIVSENRKIEEVQRRLFAEKLSQQADPANEKLLSIALTYLDNDFLAPNFDRFKEKASNAWLKDSIINKNFSAYLNQFDTRIYTFEGSVSPQPLHNDDPVSFDTLNTIYNVQGKATNISDLHYFEQSFDKYSYISRKEIKGVNDSVTLGYVFFLAEPRRYKKDALVPALFKGQRESMLPEYSGLYAYAIYAEGELIDHFNEYSFPTHIRPADLPKTEFEIRKNNGYEELWYKKTRDNVVIIARKSNYYLEAITLFAYLFSTFLLLIFLYMIASVIIRSRFRLSVMRERFQFSIRTQIHSTILLVSLLSFVVIGAATILFFINRYNRNNQERLSRTMQIMILQVQTKLKEYAVFNDGIPFYETGVNDELEKLMQETSEIHGTDVNLYDPEGALKVTSRPLIYNKGVLSDRMNPDAWYTMHQLEAIQCVREEKMGKVNYLSVYSPIRNSEGRVLAFLNVPSYSTQGELQQEISNFLVTLINLNAFIFLVAGAIALFITNRITYSFTLIGMKMREINLGKLNQAIDWNRNDEIGELVKEYNKMVAQLDESAAALAKSEREGAWRQMARQVAHEIKNPLTPMKLSIQYLQKAIDNNSPNVKEMTSNVAKTLVEQIDHLSKIASDFSQFANIGNPRNEVFDFHEVIQSLSSLYGATENLQFSWQPLPQKVLLFADKTQLNRLFTNLLQNAIEAASNRNEKIVSVTESMEGSFLLIKVSDNGEGIPEQTRDKIFTPNFTTKTSGTGLGLAMSKSIVENAHGELWFETEVGVGTTFFVKLPVLR